MSDNKTLDFYTLRFFLYKYTPDFKNNGKKIKTAQTNEDGKTTSVLNSNGTDAKDEARLSKIDRYSFDLIDSAPSQLASGVEGPRREPTPIFSKYDISQYVSNYTFNQTLNENTFSWSVSLQNSVIPLSRLNKTLRVEGPELSASNIQLLSETEAQARDMTDDWPIHIAKLNRGLNESDLNVRNSDAGRPQLTTSDKEQRRFSTKPASKPGIMLSDLIQPYDMVSMFLYKKDVPVEEIKGRIVGDKFVLDPSSRDSILNHITDEKVLRSPDNSTKDATRSIFSNEFNGFVQEKSFTVSAGNVDTVTISGDGITRLFGATRRVVKSGLFQRSIYDTLESEDQDVFTSYQNIYSDKTLKDIFIDLFGLIYRIKPTTGKKVLTRQVIVGGRVIDVPVARSSTEAERGVFITSDENVAWPSSSFYDISALEVANKFQTNPFTIPPYLLSLVMKRHGFNVRHTNNVSQIDTLVSLVNQEAKTSKKAVSSVNTMGTTGDQVGQGKTEKVTDQDLLDQALLMKVLDDNDDKKDGIQTKVGTRSPVFYSSELDVLRPYFKFFDSILRDFSPEMKTPFEIIDEIKAKTFLEFFERPDGRIFIRPPAYNDIKFTVKSSTIEVINSTYNETVRGLIARQTVGYSVDALPNVAGLNFFAYTNGKLLVQYGLIEAMADPNPNMKDVKTNDLEKTQKLKGSAIRYAEYLLRLHNAALKTGTIICGYDQRIMVGRTYYDERNNKFGYITSVSKSISTGGNATITFNLSYVRDAFFDDEKGLQFERLDRLVDLADAYAQQSLDKSVSDPEETPEGDGKTTTEVDSPTLIVTPPNDTDFEQLTTTTLQ